MYVYEHENDDILLVHIPDFIYQSLKNDSDMDEKYTDCIWKKKFWWKIQKMKDINYYYLDIVTHCNARLNKIMAETIYEEIKDILVKKQLKQEKKETISKVSKVDKGEWINEIFSMGYRTKS